MENRGAFSHWLSRRLYTFLYFTGGIVTSLNTKLLPRNYKVSVDGEESGGYYRGFSFFNGPFYGGNFCPAKNALPDDGILDILSIRGRGFLTYFLFPFYVTGRYKKFPKNFSSKQGRKIHISSNSPLQISMDDEIFYETELSIDILPAAVKFVDAGLKGFNGGRK